MNRTVHSTLGLLLWTVSAAAPALAQDPGTPAPQEPQNPAIKALLDSMAAQEAAAQKVRLQLKTVGKMPGGLEYETTGKLRVLRTPQGEMQAVHSVMEYSFADGFAGRMESVRTPDGVQILESNPTFGDVFVTMDKSLLEDLDWAGKVLEREDLAGVGDRRAASPLGRAMVEDLAMRYQLAELSQTPKGGQDGTWYGGDRKAGPGVEGNDPDMPLADRVELFVRKSDSALLEIVFLQLGKPTQRISVEDLVIGEAMPIESFRIEAKGVRPRDVRDHPPMWEQIEQVLTTADREAAASTTLSDEEKVRPSKRK